MRKAGTRRHDKRPDGTAIARPRFAEVVWRGSTIDPTRDVAAAAVLAAFEAVRSAGLSLVACYRAGVEAWRRTHPDHSPEYGARQAVAVILAAKVSLPVEQGLAAEI
jgi:hypothetical protein